MAEENKTGVRLPDPSKLVASSSPHLHSGESVSKIMFLVVLALLPSCAMGVYYFGFSAVKVLVVCVAACLFFEWFCGLLMNRPKAWMDGSAIVTGLLVGMLLSASTPWWVCVIGAFIAIVLAKQLFGGLGYNIFNPACIARIGLMVGFPVIMTTWAPTRQMAAAKSDFITEKGIQILETKNVTFFNSVIDGVTCATPLGELKEYRKMGKVPVEKFDELTNWKHINEYFMGNMGGCLGETSALALLIGGLFLIFARIIKWYVPATYIGTVAVFSAIVHAASGNAWIPGAVFQIFCGGLFIGAFFMATDMVTTPMNWKGGVIFGFGCGVLTCVIRDWGGYPEGVMFSIVLMNALTPLIDRFTANVPFGYRKPPKEAPAK